MQPQMNPNSHGRPKEHIHIQHNYVDPASQTKSQITIDLLNKHRKNNKTMTNPVYPPSLPQSQSQSRKARHQTLDFMTHPDERIGSPIVVRSLSPPNAKNNSSLLKLSKIAKAASPNHSRGQTTIHLHRNRQLPSTTISDFNKTISSENKTPATFMSPRTLGNHYNYYSQHLTFIPEDLSTSVMNKTSFSGFNDLARRVNSVNQSALGSLVLEDGKRKNSDGEPIKNIKGLGTIKKSLVFNKLQKDAYENEIYRQQKDVIMPLVSIEKTEHEKKKKIGIIKVTPSKKLYYQAAWEALVQRNTSFKALKDPEKPLEEKEAKSNQKLDDYEAKANYRKFKYKFFWYYLDNNLKTWAPDSREGHTLTSVGKCVLLYGGISHDCKNDLAIFYPGRNLWKKLPMKGDVPVMGRHGHTACLYKNNNSILFFGGEGGFSTELQYRECLSDVRILNFDSLEWMYFPCRGETISGRRHHSAAIFERSMYVYGGIGVAGNYFDEVWSLHLKTFHWTKLHLAGDRVEPLAFHTMTPCFFDKNNPQNIKSKLKNKTMEEGFYIFGGKDDTGRAINTLQFFDPKELHWKHLKTKGEPPCPRYSHTSLFYEELSILIIYGGRNESFYELNNYRQFNDIKVLNLETMTWHPTLTLGECPNIPRMSHAAALFGNSMVIFGGLGVREFMPSQARMIELSQSNVQRLVEESQEKRDSIQVRRTTILVNVEEDDENNNSPTSPLKNQERSPLFNKLMKGSLVRSDTSQSFLPIPKPNPLGVAEMNKRIQSKKDAKTLNIIEAWKKLTTDSIGGHQNHRDNQQ